MKLFALLCLPVLLVAYPAIGCSQDSLLKKIPDKYFRSIKSSTEKYQKSLNQSSEKTLSHLIKQEKLINKKLLKIDSLVASRLFSDTLKKMKNALTRKILSGIPANGYLDTTQLSLEFLQKIGNDPQQKVTSALQNIKELQGKLQQTEQIKAYIINRKKELQDQLASFTSFTKELNRYNKEAYYYREQLSGYQQSFSDRDKAEEKALAILRKIPAYNTFIEKNSQIAGLFNLGADYNTSRSIEGLQTRSQVEQLVQQQLGTDAGARAAVSQQMDQAKAKFEDLKSKFPDLNSAGEMPDFKPNSMKTKSFLQRLEYGGNIQFVKNSSYYPTTSDIALQAGYKFHKNGNVGIGIAYKLGLGQGWNHISFSHQGIGLRSYIDWKLKGTFYLSGGFEKNYMHQFSSLSQVNRTNAWQNSALLGISKKYKINSKLKGNFQLLYDFLSIHQSLSFNHIKLRFGYNF